MSDATDDATTSTRLLPCPKCGAMCLCRTPEDAARLCTHPAGYSWLASEPERPNPPQARPPAPLRRPPPRPGSPQAPLDGPRPPRRPAKPAPAPDAPGASVWTEAKVQAVLAALRSTLANLATKHGVPIEEVVALARDQLNDPQD